MEPKKGECQERAVDEGTVVSCSVVESSKGGLVLLRC